MEQIRKFYKAFREFFYDHPKFRITLEYLFTFIGSFVSAFIFAFGYKALVDPIIEGKEIGVIITGGLSGISQIVVKIFEIFGFPVNQLSPFGDYWIYIIQSVSYFLLNIPIFLLAFKKVGKKFGFFTVVNVGFYFLIVNLLPQSVTNMFYTNSMISFENDLLARALFAGICTGVSTSIAFKFDHSAGGIDVVSVYLNGKKADLSIGRITMILNAIIILTYTVLSITNDGGDLSSTTMALYSIVYFFTSSTIIDVFSSRDKKKQLQIITENENLSDIIIDSFPHSCTIIDGKGAYSKKQKYVLYTVISIYEVKRAIKIINEVDPKAFITITNVNQVVGKFFIKPRK